LRAKGEKVKVTGKKHVKIVFQAHLRQKWIDLRHTKTNKKAVLPQGNRAMPQVFFSVEVLQQHSLQV